MPLWRPRRSQWSSVGYQRRCAPLGFSIGRVRCEGEVMGSGCVTYRLDNDEFLEVHEGEAGVAD